jgi:hypothetical protein
VTLASYLKGYDITNGIISGVQGPIANGIGCLSAQLVSYLKDEPGNVYLRPPGNIDMEDYVYYVWIKENEEIMISIFNYEEECIFVGDCNKLTEEYEYSQN